MNDGQVGRRDQGAPAGARAGSQGVPVLVLGLTYREGVKELAYSRALPLIERLTHRGRGRLRLRPAARRPTRSTRCGAAPWRWGEPAPFRAIVTQTARPAVPDARPGLVPGARGRLRRPQQPARPRPARRTSRTAGSACQAGDSRRRRPASAETGAPHADRQRRRDAAAADQGGGARCRRSGHATTRSSSTPASTGTRRWPARSSRELGLPRPDHALGIGGGTQAEQTGRMLPALEPILVDERPDAVLVYGDTNSTLAGALAAAKLGDPGRPRRGRPAQLRPADARGDQPRRRRPPLALAVRADADGRREPRRGGDRRRRRRSSAT